MHSARNTFRARLIVALLTIVALFGAKCSAADEADWSRQPYHIQAILAIEGPGKTAANLSQALPGYLAARAETAVGPLWQLEIQVADSITRHRMLNELSESNEDPSEELAANQDKLVLIAIHVNADGYEFSAREFDRYTARWGTVIKRSTLQRDAIAEQLFELLHRVVSPVAQLEAAGQGKGVTISLRGANLPAASTDSRGVRIGEVFLPILRRTGQTGKVLPKGLQVIPWTFVETTAVKDDGTVEGQVRSGAARPLAARRRGRIEQVGIALRGDAAPTDVQLMSRSKPGSPLVGYGLFVQSADEETQIGITDQSGTLEVAPGPTALQTILVRHGAILLARVPIAAGFESKVVVPVVDDAARLQIETRLGAMREELIDVVARRSILMARIRRKIETGDFKDAQQLVTALNQLPGRTQFFEQLARERRLYQSSDQRVQKRLDQDIKGTETAFGQFLDPRPIRQLEEELLAAQRKKNDG